MDRCEIRARGFEDLIREKDEGSLPCYTTRATGSPRVCELCGHTVVKDGNLPDHKVIDIIDGAKAIVSVTQRKKYKCKNCRKTIFPPDLYPVKSKFSPDYLSHAAHTLLENMDTRTEADVAKEYGISVGSLSSEINQVIKRSAKTVLSAQQCDYLYFYPMVIKGKKCCVIYGDANDEDLGTILLDILPEYSAPVIQEYIAQKIDISQVYMTGCDLDPSIYNMLSLNYAEPEHQIIRELVQEQAQKFITESKGWTSYEISSAIQPVIELMYEKHPIKVYPEIQAFLDQINAWWKSVDSKIKPHVQPFAKNIYHCIDGCYLSVCKQKRLPERIVKANMLIEKMNRIGTIDYDGIVRRLLFHEKAIRQDFSTNTMDMLCTKYPARGPLGRHGAYVDIDAMLEAYKNL